MMYAYMQQSTTLKWMSLHDSESSTQPAMTAEDRSRQAGEHRRMMDFHDCLAHLLVGDRLDYCMGERVIPIAVAFVTEQEFEVWAEAITAWRYAPEEASNAAHHQRRELERRLSSATEVRASAELAARCERLTSAPQCHDLVIATVRRVAQQLAISETTTSGGAVELLNLVEELLRSAQVVDDQADESRIDPARAPAVQAAHEALGTVTAASLTEHEDERQ